MCKKDKDGSYGKISEALEGKDFLPTHCLYGAAYESQLMRVMRSVTCQLLL